MNKINQLTSTRNLKKKMRPKSNLKKKMKSKKDSQIAPNRIFKNKTLKKKSLRMIKTRNWATQITTQRLCQKKKSHCKNLLRSKKMKMILLRINQLMMKVDSGSPTVVRVRRRTSSKLKKLASSRS